MRPVRTKVTRVETRPTKKFPRLKQMKASEGIRKRNTNWYIISVVANLEGREKIHSSANADSD